jgi:hypothetical protein
LDDSIVNKSLTFSDDERNILDTHGEKELRSCELKRHWIMPLCNGIVNFHLAD